MHPYAGVMHFGELDHRSGWKIVSASSFEPGEGDPENVLDDNPATFWESKSDPDAAKPPHHLIVDFGKTLNVASIICTPRIGWGSRRKDYEVYLSDDGTQWGEPAAKGNAEKPSGCKNPSRPGS